MDKKLALSEIQAMRGKPIGEYVSAALTNSATVKLSEDLPASLDAAHDQISKANVALSESRLNTARLAVKQGVDSDEATVTSYVKAGKITPAVGAKVIALCEKKRANQLVRLAEGDPVAADEENGDVSGFLDALGEMPDTIATEEGNGAPIPGADAGAGNPMEPGAGGEEELMELASQIAKQKGIPFEEALVEAEQMLAQKGGGPQ